MFRGMGVWAAKVANRAHVIRSERIGEDSNSILGRSTGSLRCPSRKTGNREVGSLFHSSGLLNQRDCGVGWRMTSSADHSRGAPYGGVLLTCQGKFPINKLQKSSQLAILLLKILDAQPQCVATIFCLDARSRSRDAEAG